MSQRQRRRKLEKRRDHANKPRGKARLAAGAGIGIGAALAAPAGAHALNFQVSNTNDTGMDSLRAAITAANASPLDQDNILFTSGLTGTITTASSLPDIIGPTAIIGPANGDVTIDGGGGHRIVTVNPTAAGDDVSFSDLTFANGYAATIGGAGINNTDADLTVTDSDFIGNYANDEGGGILHGDGDLTVTNSYFYDNDANFGGGLYTAFIAGAATITDSTFYDNDANGANGRGGGLFSFSNSATLEITDSAFISNEADNFGGGLVVQQRPLGVTISNSTISGNTAGDGAGGALLGIEGNDKIINSTISGNTANGAAGPVGGGGAGGLFIENASPTPTEFLTVTGSTIAGNQAPNSYPGGLADFGLGTDPVLTNTIVADNTAGMPLNGTDLSGTFNAAFSLVESPTPATLNATVPGSLLTGVDPLLGALQANGGATETQRPALNSPALDKGIATGQNSEDQRGSPRPVELALANSLALGADGADIGAVELTAAEVTPPTSTPPATTPPPAVTKKKCKKGRKLRKGKCVKKKKKKKK